ncbi:MAG TPA: hypothetical protein VEG29_05240 [Candidatus Binatia bacterium]|nr:hypothetical protein [Candidatus Binatia bacterium]
MTDRSALVLSDRLLLAALVHEPTTGAVATLADEVAAAATITRQRSRPIVPWPWLPALPGLPPSPTARNVRLVALVVAVAILSSLTIGLAAMAGAFHHLPRPYGLARSGLIAFDSSGQIVVADADGQNPRPVASGPAFEVAPVFSPDGSHLAFWSMTAPDTLDLVVTDASDLDHPRTLVAGIRSESRSENLALCQTGWPTIAWSPDSERIAYTALVNGQDQVFVADLAGGAAVPIGDPGLVGHSPAWSPDGRSIAFVGGRADADRGIYLMAPDGSGAHRLTSSNHVYFDDPTWLPDGRTIAFETADGFDGSPHLIDVTTGIESGLPGRVAADLGLKLGYIIVSPDGSTFAFTASDAAAPLPFDLPYRASIAVVSADGSGARIVASGDEGGDDHALSGLGWSPDGSELLLGFTNVTKGVPDRLVIVGLDHDSVRTIDGGAIDQAAWQRLAP